MNQKVERKRQSHEAILDSAARLLRERGIKATSVMDVMRGAGLTVGGFYGHFDSKEQLFVEAIRHAARSAWSRLLRSSKSESPREQVRAMVRRYLSRSHRDHPEQGCLLPTATPEIAREGEPYRAALAEELDAFVRDCAELLGPENPDAHEEAVALVALMVGALTLSRALAGTPLSDRFLEASRNLAERVLSATRG
jgi:TetR/AcrR family transcriptional repressor of nem operon